MNQTQYQVFVAAMALGEFTSRELSVRADVNLNTVKSFIERTQYFEETGKNRPSRIKGGRPAKEWRLKESSKQEISSQVNSLWDQIRPRFASQEDATVAYSDSEARDHIRTHLACAAEYRDDQAREDELKQAKLWLEQEEMLHARWTRDGFSPPDYLVREVLDLRQHLEALEFRIDRMRYDSRVQSLTQTAIWMMRGLENWFERHDIGAFSPLLFSPEKTFEEQMEVAINNVEKLAEIPKHRLVLSLVICLGRTGNRKIRRAICDTLVRIGFFTVADALGKKFDGTPAGRQADNLPQVLIGLCVFPRMIQEGEVGIWLDRHAYSNLFTDNLVAFYIGLAQHRPGFVRERIMEQKSLALSRLEDKVRREPNYWRKFDSDNAHGQAKECFEQAMRWRQEYLAPNGAEDSPEYESASEDDTLIQISSFLGRLRGRPFGEDLVAAGT